MSQINRQKIVESVPQKGFFGHPKGLFTLFFTEFWERFSYYGMRAILLYYLYFETTKGGLGLDEHTALAIMSIYGSLVYMSGIIGGWLADRVFGTSNAVFYGGILIMFGHIVLAFPGSVGLFLVSMLLIILGTGLLKPNVSAVVGDIYAENDTRRDGGFSIFYMGINLGAFISPLLVEPTRVKFGFHAGFSIAAFGMFIGLVLFVLTKKKNLGLAGTMVANPIPADKKKKVYSTIALVVVLLVALIVVTSQLGLLSFDLAINIVTVLGVLIPIAYFAMMYNSKKTTPVEKSRLTAYIPLFIGSVMFWVIQEQGATILGLYVEKRTELELFGFTLAPGLFQSLNPLFIIILAPVFAWIWTKMGDRQPSVGKKFSIALLFAGISFLVIMIPGYLVGADALVSPIWIILSYFIVVLGELCLSPVGLSTTTKLAPAAFAAQAMSLWFLSSTAAQAINAQIVKFYSADSEIAYFGTIGGIAILLSILLYVLAPKIQKLMMGIK